MKSRLMATSLMTINSILFLLFLFNISCADDSNALPKSVSETAQSSNANQGTSTGANVKDGTFTLIGFQPHATIPIAFPLDICLMLIQNRLYAACVHYDYYQSINRTSLTIFRQKTDGTDHHQYEQIFTTKTNSARYMDCNTIGTEGYVAIVKHFNETITDNILETSPVYQITSKGVNAVQYFSQPNQNRVYLRKSGNDLYLVQTFINNELNANQDCPVYKWSGETFDNLGSLPCSNAMQVEPFVVHSDVFVAIANNRDEMGNYETDSFLYKLNVATHRFTLAQKFRTNGAIDVKYVHFMTKHGPQHFIIVANANGNANKNNTHESNAIVYRYTDGSFMAYQEIKFENTIKQFLPVLGSDDEFVLLAVQNNMEVKTFQYNGKSFVSTDIQFTGGSFGKGVSTLRTYKLSDDDVIVVANEEMSSEATNLYTPKYRFERTHVTFPTDYSKWHAEAEKKLKFYNLNSLIKNLQEMSLFIDQNGDKQSINGILKLESSKVDKIKTNLVRGNSLSINAQTIAEYLKIVHTTIEKYNNKFGQSKSPDVNSAGLQASNQTVSSSHDKPNSPIPVKFDNLLVESAIDIKLINNRPLPHFILNKSDWNLKSLKINDLVIRNNATAYGLIFSKLNSAGEIVRASKDTNQSMAVKEINLNGLLNGHKLSSLIKNALKIDESHQEIESQLNFQTVRVAKVHSQLVSKLNVANIIAINEGDFWIDQDIRFTQLVNVNQLIINDRLNHIQIENKQMDVIFYRSRNEQVIAAPITFESVMLLEPIILRGRIHSKSLDKMKPIVTIDDDILLHGDIVITGNVSVAQFLLARNIIVQNGVYSTERLKTNGIRLKDTLINIPIEFAREISVHNLLEPSTINQQRVINLVKTNTIELQEILVEKAFHDDLRILNGTCEALEINGIDLQQLEQSIVKRTAKDQIISGTIHLNKIIVDSVEASSIKFGNRSIHNLITIDTDQKITGTITIDSSLIATGNHLSIQQLATKNKILNVNIIEIIEKALHSTQRDTLHIRGVKQFDNIFIKNIIFAENDFWKIGSTKLVQEQIQSRAQHIQFSESIVLHNEFTIDQLIFTETLNDIPSAVFGKQWLLEETDQVFTSPITISQVILEDNLQINGLINEINLDDFVPNTIFKDSAIPIFINDIVFENLDVRKSILLDGLYSTLRIPQDVLFKKSETVQNISGHINFNNNVEIDGHLIIDHLNGIHFNTLCDMVTMPQQSYGVFGLEIYGDATFLTEPIVATLNQRNFEDLLKNIWFTTDSVVPLSADWFIERSDFRNSFTINGTLNGHSINDVAINYFSITKPQIIQSFVTIRNNTSFENGLIIKHLLTEGNIKTIKGNPLRIDDFFRNTLLQGVTHQFVNAPWRINEIIVEGNLTQALINGLNFVNDIVRYSTSAANHIKANKFFDILHINSLKCKRHCSIQNVFIHDWIKNSPTIQFNHTIQGITTILNPILAGDLTVLGTVNNQIFNRATILLKKLNQIIRGNVFIETNSIEKQQILPITFVNVGLQFINSILFSKFNENLLKKPLHGLPIVSLQSNIRFNRPLMMDNLNFDKQFYGMNMSEFPQEHNIDHTIQHYQRSLDAITSVRQSLDSRLISDDTKYLSHFSIRQCLVGNITNVLQIHFPMYNKGDVLIAIQNNTKDIKMISFLTWDKQMQQMIPAEGIYGIRPTSFELIDFFVFQLNTQDCIVVITKDSQNNSFSHAFFTYINGNIKRVHSIKHISRLTIVPLHFVDKNCFGRYEKNHRNFETICVELNMDNATLNIVEEQNHHVITDEIENAISPASNWLLLHHNKYAISSWQYSNEGGWIIHETIKSTQTIRAISAIEFVGQQYIAGCSEQSIDIYRNDSGHFGLIQTIANTETLNRCQFSIMKSQELVLYVVTSSLVNPFTVYRYQGLTVFQKVSSTIVLNNKMDDGPAEAITNNNIAIINDPVNHKHLIALKIGHNMQIIEGIFN